MGKLEQEVEKRIYRSKVVKAIVGTVALSGMLGLALVAPNALGAMGKLGYLPQRLYQTRKTLTRLIAAGYLVIETRNGKKNVRLTKRGQVLAMKFKLPGVQLKRPRRWDGKWRMAIFDISESRRHLRARVREVLTLFKFHRLQDSVWVYPYDCEDALTILKVDLKLGLDMRYVIADAIEYDRELRKVFKLGI